MVILLGRPDAPTDALAGYAAQLSEALRACGRPAEVRRVPWHEAGWRRALAGLDREAHDWPGRWVVVQYTALQWSRRGFPLALLGVVRVLRRRGAKLAVVFHDAHPYALRTDAGAARRVADILRRAVQRAVMRSLASRASVVFLPIDPARASWLPRTSHAVRLPIGATIRVPGPATVPGAGAVAVFAFSGPPATDAEAETIAGAVRAAAAHTPGLVLRAFGRNAERAGPALRRALSDAPVVLDVRGILPDEEVVRTLAGAAVMLFVRGQLSAGRSSAIAAIACGVPVVGYAGDETGPPLTEAGVVTVPSGDRAALAAALRQVLADGALRDELRRRSAAAFAAHFAWPAIARRMLEVLDG